MRSWVGPIHWPPWSSGVPSAAGRVRVRPPTRSRASRTITSAPASTSRRAADRPARPAPTTTTSVAAVTAFSSLGWRQRTPGGAPAVGRVTAPRARRAGCGANSTNWRCQNSSPMTASRRSALGLRRVVTVSWMAGSPPAVSWAAANGRRLARHGLRGPAPAGTDPAEIARAVCGIHAQVLSAAEVSLALRIEGATGADVRRALWEDRGLVKTYGPRGTVHLLPTRDLPMWTGALSAIPAQSPFPEGVRLTPDQADQVVVAIGTALADAELTVDELTEAVVDLAGPWAGERVMPAFQDLWPRWRQAVGTAAHRGVLCFGRNRGRRVTYTNPGRWLPGFAPALETDAVAELLRRYLHAYGPATSRQFAQWIGAPPAWAAEQFRKHRRELTEVDFEGTPTWVAAADAEVPLAGGPADGG